MVHCVIDTWASSSVIARWVFFKIFSIYFVCLSIMNKIIAHYFIIHFIIVKHAAYLVVVTIT